MLIHPYILNLCVVERITSAPFMWDREPCRRKSLVIYCLLLSNLLVHNNTGLKCQSRHQVLPLRLIRLRLVLNRGSSATKAAGPNSSRWPLLLSRCSNLNLFELLYVGGCGIRWGDSSGINHLCQVLSHVILRTTYRHWALFELVEGWSARCLPKSFLLLVIRLLDGFFSLLSCSFFLQLCMLLIDLLDYIKHSVSGARGTLDLAHVVSSHCLASRLKEVV